MKYLVIGLSIWLMSCAALGSKTKIYNDRQIGDIKTVGLITKRFDQPKNPYHKIIKESFTKTLLEGLDKTGMFKIVVLDTMENENLNIKSYVTDATVDALLIADWKLISPKKMVTDSKVQLTLLDKETKEVLMVSSHGTKFGNSYWMTPSLPKTLLDAIEGAIYSMEKKIKLKK